MQTLSPNLPGIVSNEVGQYSHVRVHCVVRYWQVGFGEDGLDVYFFDGHIDYSLLDLRYWRGVTP